MQSGEKRLCMIDCQTHISRYDTSFDTSFLQSLNISECMYLVSFQRDKYTNNGLISNYGNGNKMIRVDYLPILSLNYWLNNFSARSSLNYLPFCALQIQLAVCEAFEIDVPGDISFLKVNFSFLCFELLCLCILNIFLFCFVSVLVLSGN